jgi:acetyl esterase/lipase
MDVYIPGSASPENPAPVFLWWHGGGLLQGTRKAVVPHMLSAPDKHKICLISPDYRLAPQTRIPDILSDCRDAMEFLHSSEFAAATGNRIDPTKIVLSGSSAGGWLSLLNGIGIGYKASGLKPPRPVSGIAALYPITDLLDPFWHTQQRPTSYMDRVIPKEEVETFLDPNSPKTSGSAVTAPRAIFYHYMVQEGILTSLLLDRTNIPPNAYSIAENLKSGLFTPPPTYIIHGTIDDKVPIVQATDVVEAYKQIGYPVHYVEMPGLDHSFDKDPTYEMLDMYEFCFKCFGKN